MTVAEKVKNAKTVSPVMSSLSRAVKDEALQKIASALADHRDEILTANNKDIERSKTENLAMPLLKRLTFQNQKLLDVIKGIESTIKLEDPCNMIQSKTLLDNDFELHRVSSAIGVIGMIFESRPDALVQIATLCLKSGNCIILKGGREATETNRVLSRIIHDSSVQAGLPEGWLQLVETRDDVNSMLALDNYIDLLIPRGSNEFVQYIMNNTRIPVLGHADGICHVYIDENAEVDMAVKIANDSKTQYVAVCNAVETLLVHSSIAATVLPKIKESMPNVKILGCSKTCEIIDVEPANEKDWSTEYLDYILSVKVVESFDEAVSHINTYGSGHTDAIVTSDKEKAERFMNLVDSADVFWNCSTRFSDGFKYGLGAEIGISTTKIHARGPVGLEGLVIYKWKMYGNGQISADYSGPEGKQFLHKRIK